MSLCSGTPGFEFSTPGFTPGSLPVLLPIPGPLRSHSIPIPTDRPFKARVLGSSPSRLTINIKRVKNYFRTGLDKMYLYMQYYAMTKTETHKRMNHGNDIIDQIAHECLLYARA